jgi:hypothetical protein
MGTRHFIGVKQNGEFKVAQYGQWDGYPSGQGADILKFLNSVNLTAFAEKVSKCVFIDGDNIRQKYIAVGRDPEDNSPFVSMEISNKFAEAYPQLSRDTGAKVLTMVMEAEDGLELCDSSDFLEDGLFCEYAYIIDLDEQKLLCYSAGNEHKWGEYHLDALPDVKQMEKDAYGDEDAE